MHIVRDVRKYAHIELITDFTDCVYSFVETRSRNNKINKFLLFSHFMFFFFQFHLFSFVPNEDSACYAESCSKIAELL